MWALRGLRPTVTVQQKYEWQYVYGALEVGRSGAQFLYAETVSLEWNRAFLEQIAAHDPESLHVVIYDGAGFHHRDGAAELPANVRMLTLPPSSPELNPVEKLWNIVRDGICKSHLCHARTTPSRPYRGAPGLLAGRPRGVFLDRQRLAAARSKRFWFKRFTALS